MRVIEKDCCALRYAVWRFRISRGKATDSAWFGCAACGQHYHLDRAGSWEPVSAAEAITDMVQHDPRGHLS